MAIRKKLLELNARLQYIQKSGKNEHFRYRYVAHADLMAVIHPLLVELGIISIPIYELESTNDKGLIVASCTLQLIDPDSPEDEEVIAKALGGGIDSGDKAPMKAMTAANKYAWMHLLNLATGDDPEADEETDKRGAK